MKLYVRKILSTASGASYVVLYEADVELVPGDVHVHVVRVDPADAWPADVDAARDAIRRGAEHVLQPRGHGANIRVDYVFIHPVDFKPRRFEHHTAEALASILDEGTI